MKAFRALMILIVLIFAGFVMADGSQSGGGNLNKFQWFTSSQVGTTDSEVFVDIPDTYVTFATWYKLGPRDVTIHFCGQLDNSSGGRTQLTVLVDDGPLAEPNQSPGPILAWDSFLHGPPIDSVCSCHCKGMSFRLSSMSSRRGERTG